MKWNQYFSTRILNRGYDYYQINAVRVLNSSSEFIEANVMGSSLYNVRINFIEDEIVSMYCNCPYEDNCKHLAATLYYLEDHPELLKKENNIGELVSNTSKNKLQEFLILELANNNDLANKFKLFTNSEFDSNFYFNKLYTSLNDSFHVIKFIDEDIQILTEFKQLNLIFELCDIIIDYCEELLDYGDYKSFDIILDKLDTLFIKLFNLGYEKEVLKYLGNVILTNDNISILELLTDTYSRIGDVEKLFDEHHNN